MQTAVITPEQQNAFAAFGQSVAHQAPSQNMFNYPPAPAGVQYISMAPQQEVPVQHQTGFAQQAPAQQQVYQQQVVQQAPVQQVVHQAPVAPIVQQPVAPMPLFFSVKTDPTNGWMHAHFPSGFTGTKSARRYFSPEHYYVEKKAIAFGDEATRAKIMSVTCNPIVNGQFNWAAVDAAHAQIHALAHGVVGFNPEVWGANAVQVMRQALMYNFCQNEPMFKLLMSTGDSYLIYASAEDRYWGIGCTEEQAKTGQLPIPQWGQNLMGLLLMEIRKKLLTEGRPEWAYIVDPAPVPQISTGRNDNNAPAPIANMVQQPAVVVAEPVVAQPTVAPVTNPAVVVEPSVPVAERVAVIEANRPEQKIETVAAATYEVPPTAAVEDKKDNVEMKSESSAPAEAAVEEAVTKAAVAEVLKESPSPMMELFNQ